MRKNHISFYQTPDPAPIIARNNMAEKALDKFSKCIYHQAVMATEDEKESCGCSGGLKQICSHPKNNYDPLSFLKCGPCEFFESKEINPAARPARVD
jgi:hypothetical protein